MARKPHNDDGDEVRELIADTVSKMTSLGTYKAEFDPLVRIYAQLRAQYRILTERFERDNYIVSVDTAQGGEKKSPLVATLENLRKDILAYSDRLGLNPKALDSMDIKSPKRSKLDAALNGS